MSVIGLSQEHVRTYSNVKKRNWDNLTEPRMSKKFEKSYKYKIKMALRVAISEKRRVVAISPLGFCNGVPPFHAAELYKTVLSEIDPGGKYFDIVAFVVQEDESSFKSYSPDGILNFLLMLAHHILKEYVNH